MYQSLPNGNFLNACRPHVRVRPAAVVALALLLLGLVGCSGYQGRAYVREDDGAIGPPLPGVQLTFTSEDGTASYQAATDAGASYRRRLPVGRYTVTAEHPFFQHYDSSPGFFVVTGDGYQTGNVFLRRLAGTVVIVTRHAEKAPNGVNPNLADPEGDVVGLARADHLAELAVPAQVAAAYATEWCRTAQTAQPTAQPLALTLQLMDSTHPESGVGACNPPITVPTVVLPSTLTTPGQLAAQVLASHEGQVVLVVGHSNTVPAIVEALSGTSPCPTYLPLDATNACIIPDTEYRHLFVVTVPKTGPASLRHTLYGGP